MCNILAIMVQTCSWGFWDKIRLECADMKIRAETQLVVVVVVVAVVVVVVIILIISIMINNSYYCH